jgi:16S rRNA (guanine966-N2)-methyltransferase
VELHEQMRIIAGQLKGRRLQGPKGAGVRPTSDSLRETLFNVLGPTLDGARVLDGFAGTGAIGLEALSRGAAHVTFVERDRRELPVLKANIAACGADTACMIVPGDFASFAADETSATFDLVVLDPPYDMADLEATIALAASLVAPAGRLVLEHSRRRGSPETVSGVIRTRVLAAGDSALSFYSLTGAA